VEPTLDTNSLDYIACQLGTDKSTRRDLPSIVDGYEARRKEGHGYTIYYEHYFSPLRYEPVRLLEIGVLDGKSLMTWRTWFPRASVYGLDIDPSCIRFQDDRTKIFIGSQADPRVLADIGKHVPEGLDIIIDDGSHYVEHVIASLHGLFGFLKPGGFYVIEDLGPAGRTDWGAVSCNKGMDLERSERGNDPQEMVRFLQAVRGREDVADLTVHLKRICFIHKASHEGADERYPWPRGDRLEELFPPPPSKRSLSQRVATKLLRTFRKNPTLRIRALRTPVRDTTLGKTVK
jgi:SAM-dependent methyltransferase